MLDLSDNNIIASLADWLVPKIHVGSTLQALPGQIHLYAPKNRNKRQLKYRWWIALTVHDGQLDCYAMGDIFLWSCDLADPSLFNFIDSELRTTFYAKD